MPINSYENYALSWRPVKERLTRPYYQSLVQQLEADILSGALQHTIIALSVLFVWFMIAQREEFRWTLFLMRGSFNNCRFPKQFK
jgi:hypothetical protein